MVRQGKLFIVSAPSGAGKTTLVTAAIEHLTASGLFLQRVITYTTKQPRPGEQPGKDYHFISVTEFKEKIAQGFFIEWSTSYGCYYGSPKYILQDMHQGKSFVLVIDRAGARQVCAQHDAVLVWIYTKDFSTLQKRLANRATENIEQMQRRLTLAVQELQEEKREQLYQHHILNDDFQEALQELKSIVLGSLKNS